MQQGNENDSMSHSGTGDPYLKLALNLLLSAIIMYLGMFAMIWSWGEFVQNFNFFYMAMIMWAPMAAVMLWTMKDMYPYARTNLALYAVFAAVFILSLWGMRDQLLVDNNQFLRSMIPHHSGAILMCEKSSLSDPEIKELCEGIVRGQAQEIAQMKAILARRLGH